MRGYYSALYLDAISRRFAKYRGAKRLDIGASVDLITGTSTGAILACALAKGLSLDKVASLYKEKGRFIFPRKIPSGFGFELLRQLRSRPALIEAGAMALEEALAKELKKTKVIDIWEKRNIALAIPAVEMSTHRSWVFKTPHLANSKGRDNDYKLVDVCLASTAAPVFRSLAAINTPDSKQHLVFADGGLWANSPVLVGLTDALEMTNIGDTIEIYCLGTCPRPEGTPLTKKAVHMGLGDWNFGAKVPTVANSAQEFAYFHMARMLAKHVQRELKIVQFPRGTISQQLMPFLDLDETSEAAFTALEQQAQADVSIALSDMGNDQSEAGKLLTHFFENAKTV